MKKWGRYALEVRQASIADALRFEVYCEDRNADEEAQTARSWWSAWVASRSGEQER